MSEAPQKPTGRTSPKPEIAKDESVAPQAADTVQAAASLDSFIDPTKITFDAASPTPKTTLQTIKDKWSAIIEKISENNHSLTFILKMCGLKNLDQRGLTLTVPYSFHKEKLEETKSRRIIEDYVESLCGERIPILYELETAPVLMAETELATLATAFGGEVVG